MLKYSRNFGVFTEEYLNSGSGTQVLREILLNFLLIYYLEAPIELLQGVLLCFCCQS